MRRLKEDMDAVDFSRMIREDDITCRHCLNCPHSNGECVEWAKQGKCRAYHFMINN